ncbi:MAG: hypothetical protein ACUVQY_06740 [Thermoproteota archaeon]
MDFDRFFAKVDGRRNVYVLYMILFSLLDKPPYAIYAMLVRSAVTAVVYAVRAVQHMCCRCAEPLFHEPH